MMKPKASPLRMLDFAVTEFQYKFIPPGDDDDFPGVFQAYELGIDFGINADDFLSVSIRAEINKDGKLAGYSISAEVTCIFRFGDDEKLPDEVRQNLEGYSTVYIALNSLRGIISSFTASGPLGRYVLPSIDLNDLIHQKMASFDGEKQSQKVKKGAGSGKKRIPGKRAAKK